VQHEDAMYIWGGFSVDGHAPPDLWKYDFRTSGHLSPPCAVYPCFRP
jgi:hypothetical protein